MHVEDFDPESEFERMLELLQAASEDPTLKALSVLELQLKQIDDYIEGLEEQGEYSEIFSDFAFELAPLINGTDFRVDQVTDAATRSPELLALIARYISIRDENVEVVLATNPFISEELKWQLADSEFEWEEDGTREALARNQKDPNLLEYLAKVGNTNVRHQVALSPSTPPHVLDDLANDIEQCNFQMEECLFGELSDFRGFARWCVAQNPNTSKGTLERIVCGELEPINDQADSEILRIAQERLK